MLVCSTNWAYGSCLHREHHLMNISTSTSYLWNSFMSLCRLEKATHTQSSMFANIGGIQRTEAKKYTKCHNSWQHHFAPVILLPAMQEKNSEVSWSVHIPIRISATSIRNSSRHKFAGMCGTRQCWKCASKYKLRLGVACECGCM